MMGKKKEIINKDDIILTPDKLWYINQYKNKYLQFPTSPEITETLTNSKMTIYIYMGRIIDSIH